MFGRLCIWQIPELLAVHLFPSQIFSGGTRSRPFNQGLWILRPVIPTTTLSYILMVLRYDWWQISMMIYQFRMPSCPASNSWFGTAICAYWPSTRNWAAKPSLRFPSRSTTSSRRSCCTFSLTHCFILFLGLDFWLALTVSRVGLSRPHPVKYLIKLALRQNCSFE